MWMTVLYIMSITNKWEFWVFGCCYWLCTEQIVLCIYGRRRDQLDTGLYSTPWTLFTCCSSWKVHCRVVLYYTTAMCCSTSSATSMILMLMLSNDVAHHVDWRNAPHTHHLALQEFNKLTYLVEFYNFWSSISSHVAHVM